MSGKTHLNSSWLLWGGVGSEAGTSTVLGPWAIALANKSSCGLKGNWNCFGPRALVTKTRNSTMRHLHSSPLRYIVYIGVLVAPWYNPGVRADGNTTPIHLEFKHFWPFVINLRIYKELQILSKKGLKGSGVCLLTVPDRGLLFYLKNKSKTLLQKWKRGRKRGF